MLWRHCRLLPSNATRPPVWPASARRVPMSRCTRGCSVRGGMHRIGAIGEPLSRPRCCAAQPSVGLHNRLLAVLIRPVMVRCRKGGALFQLATHVLILLTRLTAVSFGWRREGRLGAGDLKVTQGSRRRAPCAANTDAQAPILRRARPLQPNCSARGRPTLLHAIGAIHDLPVSASRPALGGPPFGWPRIGALQRENGALNGRRDRLWAAMLQAYGEERQP